MNEMIKQRIEQIRRGEVPEGYKKTKVGIVPDEWKLYKLCEISEELHECAGDATYETLSISACMGFVNQANKFGKEISGAQYSKYTVLKKGDFSYNKGNSKKYPQGCIYQLKDREAAAVPNVFESFRLTKGNNDFFEQLFMYGFLNSQLFSKINHGVRDDGLLNLRGNDFYSSYVLFPPLPEQEKIAEILSAQDKLIALKEKLIEEKMKQKKALMQQFLTGEKRLPGFRDEWISFSISEVVLHITTGLNPRDNFRFNEKGECFYVTIKNFHDGCIFLDERCDKITQHDRELIHTRSKIDKGDILFASIGRVGDTYLIKEAPTEWDINESVFAIRANTNKVYSELLNYVLSSPFSKKKFISKVTGSTFQSIKINDLLKHKIKIPLSFDEQRQLIEFFDIIEKEVILLQKELDQEKQKKKALMQLLLTGIVRVDI